MFSAHRNSSVVLLPVYRHRRSDRLVVPSTLMSSSQVQNYCRSFEWSHPYWFLIVVPPVSKAGLAPSPGLGYLTSIHYSPTSRVVLVFSSSRDFAAIVITVFDYVQGLWVPAAVTLVHSHCCVLLPAYRRWVTDRLALLSAYSSLSRHASQYASNSPSSKNSPYSAAKSIVLKSRNSPHIAQVCFLTAIVIVGGGALFQPWPLRLPVRLWALHIVTNGLGRRTRRSHPLAGNYPSRLCSKD